ncbi:MAG: hypothetical protein AAGK09_14250 [Planctomycetota bacterium]
MSWMPAIGGANRVGGMKLGPGHTLVLFDQIESLGAVKYQFMSVAFDNQTQAPCLVVTSEVNSMAETMGGGSHYLGLLTESGHANYGDSDDWADPKKFFVKSAEIAAERLGVDLK